MSPNGGGVEHLHEMGGLAVRGERLEQGLEDTRLAQTPEPFPDAVPIAELGRESPPSDVVDREIVQRLEELAVVAALVAPPRAAGPKQLQNRRPITRSPPRRKRFGATEIDWVISQKRTMDLGDRYARFRAMEGAPHGAAHGSFDGPISQVPMAAKDPLFFL